MPNLAQSALLEGYLTEEEIAAERRKSKRTLRLERQLGIGPPYTKDGRNILYPVEGFRAWLKASERRPVRGAGAKVA